MFKDLSLVELEEVLASEEYFYLLRNVKVSSSVSGHPIVKIGRTSQAVIRRVGQYTFDTNQPSSALHEIFKAAGIASAADHRKSWRIEEEWTIPPHCSSKKVEDRVKAALNKSAKGGDVVRFGNSEYYSISELMIGSLIHEINFLFERIKGKPDSPHYASNVASR